MPPPPRRVWVNRLILFAVVALPVTVFFITQQMAAFTRSGNVDDVWFITTRRGPMLLARDRITVGSETTSTKVVHRLSLVDARSGDRVARERMTDAVEFLGVGDQGLWFRRKHDKADVHLRDPYTLERLDTANPAQAPSEPAPEHLPFGTEVTLPGGVTFQAQALDAAKFPGAAIVLDARSGQPIVLESPSSFLVLHKSDTPGGPLLLSRVDAQGKALWTARLERQRVLRAASVVDGALVVATSGAARDFAIAVELSDGRTRWVHYF